MAFDAGAVVGRVDLQTGNFVINANKITKTNQDMKKGLLGAQVQFALLERAIGAVTGFLKSSADAWAKAEEATAQTEARIKSTGGVAGLTTKNILDLSSAMEEMTTYADDDVQAMDNLLLTFTNIRGDTFTDATKIILDMSTALGQDLKSSAVQVGKALQDPVLGVTALRRVGVNFTEQQKEQIKVMLAAGKVEEAQAIILKELNTEFGGAAAAAKDTFGGAMKSLNNDVDNMKESIGKALAPVIVDFSNILKPAVKWLQKIDEGTVKTALAFGGLIVATFAVGKAIGAVSNMLKAGITPLQGILIAMAAIGAIVTIVNEVSARARVIHGELAEQYVKEYEAIDGQVKRYDELKNKTNLSTREKRDLIKIEGTLKQQLGEESAFIKDQSGRWRVNATSVAAYKKERLDLAIRELKAQEQVNIAEKAFAERRVAFINEYKARWKKGYLDPLDHYWLAQNKIAFGFQLTASNAEMEMFAVKELGKTTDNLNTTQGQLSALTTAGVQGYNDYNNSIKENNDVKTTNTIVTDQMLEAEAKLADLLKENSLEFLSEKEREIQALKDRAQIMRNAGASEAMISEYYNKKLAQINDKYADEAAKAWQETTNKITEAFGAVIKPVQMVWDSLSGIWNQALENEQVAIDNEYEKKKANIEKTVLDEEEKTARLSALEEEYDAKQAELKKKQWAADKAGKLGQAIINTAMGITSALAVFPPWLGIALAAVVGAAGAVQIGMIAAQEMPAFKMGGNPLAGSFGLVGEEGPEIVQFPKTSHVYTAKETRDIMAGAGASGGINFNHYGDNYTDVDVDRQNALQSARLQRVLRGAA